jgi:hypothetical protein
VLPLLYRTGYWDPQPNRGKCHSSLASNVGLHSFCQRIVFSSWVSDTLNLKVWEFSGILPGTMAHSFFSLAFHSPLVAVFPASPSFLPQLFSETLQLPYHHYCYCYHSFHWDNVCFCLHCSYSFNTPTLLLLPLSILSSSYQLTHSTSDKVQK